MKAKKMKKKLSLNKQTVAHLGREEMDEAKGGCTTTIILTYLTLCDDANIRFQKFPTNPCHNR